MKTAVDYIKEKLMCNEYWYENMTFDQIIDQAKAMEKEQMCSFAEFVATYPDKNININGEMLHAKSKYDGAERTVDLLETFKSE
jgi:hypothetical protein